MALSACFVAAIPLPFLKVIELRSKPFEEWLSNWVWTPLSGDANHLEYTSLGYFALSYI